MFQFNPSQNQNSMASITKGIVFVPGLTPVLPGKTMVTIATHSSNLNRRLQLMKPSLGANRKSSVGITSSYSSENDRFNSGSDDSELDYFEQSTELIKSSSGDGGPPRWFSPLTGASRRFKSCPLLLFLPGVAGVGLELALQHKKLGEIFEVWCLHIPIMDRTPFLELVTFVEETVRLENKHNPERPIYLVGECFGGCLALYVAARNQEIDLSLILANPATSFQRSGVQSIIPILELMPKQVQTGVPSMLSLFPGYRANYCSFFQQAIGLLPRPSLALANYLSVLGSLISTETIQWRLKMVQSAANYANFHLFAVKSHTLILSRLTLLWKSCLYVCSPFSGKDQLLPSKGEGERLYRLMFKCENRCISEKNHFLFLDPGFDLVTIIKYTRFYRRRRSIDYVADYIPPSNSEFQQVNDRFRWMEVVFNPVMLSTLGSGEIVRGLEGIPSEGPVIFVGNHMMLGIDVIPLVLKFWIQRDIHVKGIAHPLIFRRKDDILFDLSLFDDFDQFRMMGAVPVSASNFFKLLSSESHVLLYPGGLREAIHKKGEEYKLFWPEQPEFIRMAARFGAKIIPFGVVGEDDISQLLLDYDDLTTIPLVRAGIEELTKNAGKLRTDTEGEVTKQHIYLPIMVPKLPGRLYYYFGKPIETEGRKHELRNREKVQELYLEVKCEVEKCISFLQEKRENDPYRSLLARLVYQAMHGFNSEVPTFDI